MWETIWSSYAKKPPCKFLTYNFYHLLLNYTRLAKWFFGVKMPATRPDEQNYSISGTHTAEGENELPRVVLLPPHAYWGTCVHPLSLFLLLSLSLFLSHTHIHHITKTNENLNYVTIIFTKTNILCRKRRRRTVTYLWIIKNLKDVCFFD